MSQIFRAIKTDLIQFGRFYGCHRNLHSHYDTLRIPVDASQREIRLAFLKLSKEMHPDLSKKTNHTDFVKINEAYKILSKPETKQLYDINLKAHRSMDGRPMRVVYYDSESNHQEGPTLYNSRDQSSDYYGIKGIKRVSNGTIALLCLVFSAFGISIQTLLISKAMAFRKEQVLATNAENAEAYLKVRERASQLDMKGQIAAFEERAANQKNDFKVKFQS